MRVMSVAGSHLGMRPRARQHGPISHRHWQAGSLMLGILAMAPATVGSVATAASGTAAAAGTSGASSAPTSTAAHPVNPECTGIMAMHSPSGSPHGPWVGPTLLYAPSAPGATKEWYSPLGICNPTMVILENGTTLLVRHDHGI